MTKKTEKDPNPAGREVVRYAKARGLNRKSLWEELIRESAGEYDFGYSTMCRKLEDDDRLSARLLKHIAKILGVKPGDFQDKAD